MKPWLLCRSWSIQNCLSLCSLNINPTDSAAATWIHTQRQSGGQYRPGCCFVFPVCCITVISSSDRTLYLYTVIKWHWPTLLLALSLTWQQVHSGHQINKANQLRSTWISDMTSFITVIISIRTKCTEDKNKLPHSERISIKHSAAVSSRIYLHITGSLKP